ncbi:MAG: 2-C-methyl-D-erythritol 2,4-cyclodiphosphate synthase [Acidimicrobiales bacterium]
MPGSGPAPDVWAIVVAAGSGARYGGLKQFELLAGRPVVEWSIQAARAVAGGGVVAVLPPGCRAGATSSDIEVEGGLTRAGSVRNGLSALPADARVVVVHDAARPLAGRALFEAVVGAISDGASGAVPAVPVTDTIKRVKGERVTETLDRSELMAVQTPQAFLVEALRRAHSARGAPGRATARYVGPPVTDDAQLLEAQGEEVRIVAGDAGNLKLTAPSDLRLAEVLLSGTGETLTGPAGPAAGAGAGGVPVRVGLGFDVHPFSTDPARPLVLGGQTIAGERGLEGHSDADVVAHALADALLGAAGLGDIGTLFPATDQELLAADSMGLLDEVMVMVSGEGFAVGNADVSVIAESPPLASAAQAMSRRLARVLGAPVGVKAKRAEGLGAIGRVEGIACFAVVALSAAGTGGIAAGGR